MRGIRTRATCLALAVGLTAALAACGGGAPSGGTVTVLVPWDVGSSELKAFEAVASQFTNGTGIQVVAESTRALTQQLSADIAAGETLPDIADLPNPSAVYQYRADIVPPGVSLSSYDDPWSSLVKSVSRTKTASGTVAPGTVLAIPVKADIKSLLWYRTASVKSPPTTWADLTSLSAHGTPWCLGLASGPTSGWPGADWIADIMLSMTTPGDHEASARTYEEWLNGTLNWSAPPVRTAWTDWGTLMRIATPKDSAMAGGPAGALENSFSGGLPSGCKLEHGALSAISPPSTTGYGYVPFPSMTTAPAPVLVSGDFMALFTANPNAKRFLTWLASTAAQQLWVNEPGGYAFSADSAVTPAMYRVQVQRRLAALLAPHSTTTLCFTAADMMTPDVSAAFYQAVLDYVNNPASLTSSLAGLEETEKAAPSPPIWKYACHTP